MIDPRDPIYGPLTERENELVNRSYMGALLAKEIINSIETPFYGFEPANKATHICDLYCECDPRLERIGKKQV